MTAHVILGGCEFLMPQAIEVQAPDASAISAFLCLVPNVRERPTDVGRESDRDIAASPSVGRVARPLRDLRLHWLALPIIFVCYVFALPMS